jgi:hypothetical protein
MEKEKFLTNLFRLLTILTPMLMLVKSMSDKSFHNIHIELIITSVYALIIVFIIGFLKGSNLSEKAKQKDKT